jgi:microcystin-dependent protein
VPQTTFGYNNATGALNTGTFSTIITPQLQIAGNKLSAGPSSNSVALNTYTSGTGITVAGGPDYTISATALTTSLTAGSNNNISISGSAPGYTVSAPSYSVGFPLPNVVAITNGVNSSSVNIPTYTTGAGLSIAGTPPNFTITANTTGTNGVWGSMGNAGTSTLTNFIGTTDNMPLQFRVNNVSAGTINNTSQLVYLGYNSGTNQTSATENVGIGFEALYSTTSGSTNVAIGSRAMKFNSIGTGNVAIGRSTLLSNTSGIRNTGVGSDALSSNVGGSNNTSLGFESGFINVSGSGNVFLGHMAGRNESGSNKLYISNNSATPLLYGDFSTGQLGINTTTLGAYDLNVYNAGTGAAMRLSNSGTAGPGLTIGLNSSGSSILNYENTPMYLGTNGANRLTIAANGNVGIGNITPTENLQVESVSSSQLAIVANSSSMAAIAFGTTANHAMGQVRYDNATNSMNFITNNTANRMYIDNTGNIGIGTSTPGYNPGAAKYLTLASASSYVNAPASFEFIGAFPGTATPFAKIDFNSIGASSTSSNVARIAALNAGVVGQGVLAFSTRDGSTLLERMRIDETGKVGIGTTSPSASLHVNGTMKLTDGTQGINKVLVSDNAGNASWQASSFVPPGMVIAYAGNATPAGWFICDGSAVSRTTYSVLFTALGTAWGVGDGSTTFNLPDMRGMFLRGVDAAAGNDPDKATRVANGAGGNSGNNVGSEQADQFKGHTHSLSNHGSTNNYSTLLGGTPAWDPGGTATTSTSGGNETRPKNVYVYYMIKY